ncbi:hypothetical protein [Sorangium sp. So ce426]|uniref:hypothetical protein n=1 Tax=Sorangium sp. So ce426 TaxID=3133312 RepID=UPI003F5AE13A
MRSDAPRRTLRGSVARVRRATPVGVPSGVWLGARLVRGSAHASTWLGASGIAVLAASLGCTGLGISGLLGAGAGLVLGAASAKVLLRAPT